MILSDIADVVPSSVSDRITTTGGDALLGLLPKNVWSLARHRWRDVLNAETADEARLKEVGNSSTKITRREDASKERCGCLSASETPSNLSVPNILLRPRKSSN